jgi:hypothetical protein
MVCNKPGKSLICLSISSIQASGQQQTSDRLIAFPETPDVKTFLIQAAASITMANFFCIIILK